MVAPTYVGVQIVPFSGIVRKVAVGTAVCSDEFTNVENYMANYCHALHIYTAQFLFFIPS